MKLTDTQIKFYKDQGYLIVENIFSKEEINTLKESAKIFEELKFSPNVICEKNGSIRSVFSPNNKVDSYDWLCKQKRLVEPARQLIGNDVYMYQFKLNNKKALSDECWEWHQDFPYWHLDDGVRFPDMVSIMILFQDTTILHGALLFIPKSHKDGVVDFEEKKHLQIRKNENKKNNLINSLNNDLKYTVKKDLIISNEENIAVGEGGIGTCIFFHPNLFHASNSNLSPIDRNTAIITYNDIENLPSNQDRPDFLCSRNYDAIKFEEREINSER